MENKGYDKKRELLWKTEFMARNRGLSRRLMLVVKTWGLFCAVVLHCISRQPAIQAVTVEAQDHLAHHPYRDILHIDGLCEYSLLLTIHFASLSHSSSLQP